MPGAPPADVSAMTPGQRWTLFLTILVLLLCAHIYGDLGDRRAIRRDLAKKGCAYRRSKWLPGRRGLALRISDDPASGVDMVYGAAYQVAYTNRDGTARVAICLMGPDRLVFWTDEHPDPGFDRHGFSPPGIAHRFKRFAVFHRLAKRETAIFTESLPARRAAARRQRRRKRANFNPAGDR